MSEYVHIVGVEQIQRAALAISGAAEQFNRTVGYLDEILTRHRMLFDEQITRLEHLLARQEGEG